MFKLPTLLVAVAASCLTVSTSAIPFTETFDGSAATNDPAGFSDASGGWTLSGTGTYNNTTVSGTVLPTALYTPFTPSAGEADYTVSAAFTFDDGGSETSMAGLGGGVTFGVIARYQDTGNLYEARVDGDSFDIVRRGGSGTAVISGTSHALITDANYVIQFTVNGTSLSATLTGDNGTNLSLAVTDTNFNHGGAGLKGRIGAGSSIADVLAVDSFSIIPEPASLSLIAVGLLMVNVRRRTTA